MTFHRTFSGSSSAGLKSRQASSGCWKNKTWSWEFWMIKTGHYTYSLFNIISSPMSSLSQWNKMHLAAAAAAAKLLQSCLTLCDPIDGSPLGSSVPGILQARILEWVAISFSKAWKQKVKVKLLSHAWLLATPWTATHQFHTIAVSIVQ